MKDYLESAKRKRSETVLVGVRVDRDLKTKVEKKLASLKKEIPEGKFTLQWLVGEALKDFLKVLDHI